MPIKQKQQGKIQIGNMLLDAEFEIVLEELPLDVKLDIQRMETWFHQPISYATYIEYIQYGKSPIDPTKTVEGSLVAPITDEGRLLG